MGKNKMRPALAAFLLMLTMSLLSTALSFFVSPVCADLGFSLLALGIGVYQALVCLALGGSALGTLMPVVVRQLFGGRDYAAIWSVVISCSSVASFLSTPGWGMVYDTFGTYTPALIAMPVIQLAAIAALLAAFRGKK